MDAVVRALMLATQVRNVNPSAGADAVACARVDARDWPRRLDPPSGAG